MPKSSIVASAIPKSPIYQIEMLPKKPKQQTISDKLVT